MKKNRRFAVCGGKPLFPKKIELTRPVVPKLKEIAPFLRNIFKSRQLTNNAEYLKNFESKLADYFNVKHCRVFCNGTTALNVAIRALGLSGEVITTPFTFPATVHALRWLNVTPVFCDIDPHTYNLDSNQLESHVTDKTTGVLPVHVFGNPCDVEGIERLSKRNNLKVVYDAAHAFGVTIGSRSIGNFGDASIFSFHATKLFNTLEGGCITFKGDDLDQIIRDLRNFGIRSETEVMNFGINGKMDEIRASIGIVNLAKVVQTIKMREAITQRYLTFLKNIPGVAFQKMTDGASLNQAYFTIRIKPEFGLTRDEVYTCMREEGIMVRKYFWPICSDFPEYRNLPSARKELLPNAVLVSDQILALPLYETLTIKEQDCILEMLHDLYSRGREVKPFLQHAQ